MTAVGVDEPSTENYARVEAVERVRSRKGKTVIAELKQNGWMSDEALERETAGWQILYSRRSNSALQREAQRAAVTAEASAKSFGTAVGQVVARSSWLEAKPRAQSALAARRDEFSRTKRSPLSFHRSERYISHSGL